MINLRSDTGPSATPAMLEAASRASVGFAGVGDGPTLADVEARVASMLGTDAGLFVPSGSLANQVAARVHADRGAEVLLERASHLYTRERAGLAQLSGLQARPLDARATGGVPTPEQVATEHSAGSLREPATGLLALENTHNLYGGVPLEPEPIAAAAEAAHARDVPVHLDGARLAQAAVALDEPLEAFAASVDSAYLDLAKQGGVAGAVLVGSTAFVDRAREVRQLFGGHLESFGMLAAATLSALDGLDRIADDQANARRLADAIEELPGLAVTRPETNLVYVDVSGSSYTPGELTAACESRGLLTKPFGRGTVRFCTHRDVSAADVDDAAGVLSDLVGG